MPNSTADYRVEQLFLIHAQTGLLLEHVSADSPSQDADLVSAMLTAICEFVRDGFRMGSDSSERLEAFRVGELTVTIERGPHAMLAAVLRGDLPSNRRDIFQHALEAIHRQHGPELQAFNGDASPFQRSRPLLQTCLIA